MENNFQLCFLIYLRPPSLEPKSKVGKSPARVNWLGEYISRLFMKS